MQTKITAKTAAKIAPAPDRDLFVWDVLIPGFGFRVKPSNVKTWIVQVKVGGKTRRKALGRVGTMGLDEARARARELLMGGDFPQVQSPAGSRTADRPEASPKSQPTPDPVPAAVNRRPAATVADLARTYLGEDGPTRELSAEYLRHARHVIDRCILPEIGDQPVDQVGRHDVVAILRPLRKTRYQHNRVRSVLGKLFNLAIAEDLRSDNPVTRVPRMREQARERYLSQGELSRLSRVLDEEPDQDSADVIRLLLLTGARRGEVLNATWGEFDLEGGVWTKLAPRVKQRRTHRVPLSQAAVDLLRQRQHARYEITASDGRKRRYAPELSDFVFPGRDHPSQPRENLKRIWANIRKRAGLQDVRIHDLRHTYASVMVSQGYSLAVIGQLLGHSQTATTARYAHLQDEALRRAAEGVSGLLLEKSSRTTLLGG